MAESTGKLWTTQEEEERLRELAASGLKFSEIAEMLVRTKSATKTRDDLGYEVDRYRKLLAEAVDEKKRLALINLLIEERAKERLEAQRAADRDTITATTIAGFLGASGT